LAIAGLPHGEVAGLRWHHCDPTLEPLGRLVIATSYDTGRTKTELTRRAPVHAPLAKILAAWKLSHWERIYGPRADLRRPDRAHPEHDADRPQGSERSVQARPRGARPTH
jgi:hypothetical protein